MNEVSRVSLSLGPFLFVVDYYYYYYYSCVLMLRSVGLSYSKTGLVAVVVTRVVIQDQELTTT